MSPMAMTTTELVVLILFEMIVFSMIVETVYEWRKRKRHWQLVPILAYVLSMLAFAGLPRSSLVPPRVLGLAWFAVGLVLRLIARGPWRNSSGGEPGEMGIPQ